MNELSEQTQQLSNELYELTLRAKRTNYKNKPPRLPKNINASTLSGFVKRFSSWKSRLQNLELELERDTIRVEANLLTNFLPK